ncbi:FAD binding domain-containing protein [Nocardioides deserti]|uniref:Xanthine dehydrogenase family protein subunit M n=1 Tax=Nocardioides deserti TaxID=1588644 RepID=A0ABR6UD66_9ACTN|nr:xanthine dehydrogenase family protein subunit M [Nocardioides deserti]MBC2962401.1 xanthine dehydrogenase family protein subunit M [Nocardioides deserti]GGO77915.1 FAD-binding molybdopterin dehydrogenase [Nocardioides deserti]
MKELTYHRADDAASAVALVAGDPDARFLGGGTNLVDHLKLGVTSPTTLVDVSRLPLDEVTELPDGGLRIGTNVRNSDLAAHRAVRRGWPVVARALLAGASGQIRNQATTGGNLLQRTRCVYFQDVTTPCNKRDPGTGCSAIGGYGRYNAVLGASEACVTTHPSDLAVALAAVDATVVVLGQDGERRVPMSDFHRLPGDRPEQDTTLAHGELVTAVELPATGTARRSTYRKARDRASYAFALVSVAAGLELDDDGRVRDVRIAWGGVAHKPWRAEVAEAELRGRFVSEESVRAAAEAELAAAVTDEQTAYKVPMVRNLTALTLTGLAEGATR